MPSRQDGVAGIVPGREGNPDSGSHRDIVVHSDSGGRLHRISDLHPAYMPLHFVLLFPHGELQWGAHLIPLQRPPLSFVEPAAAVARRAFAQATTAPQPQGATAAELLTEAAAQPAPTAPAVARPAFGPGSRGSPQFVSLMQHAQHRLHYGPCSSMHLHQGGKLFQVTARNDGATRVDSAPCWNYILECDHGSADVRVLGHRSTSWTCSPPWKTSA